MKTDVEWIKENKIEIKELELTKITLRKHVYIRGNYRPRRCKTWKPGESISKLKGMLRRAKDTENNTYLRYHYKVEVYSKKWDRSIRVPFFGPDKPKEVTVEDVMFCLINDFHWFTDEEEPKTAFHKRHFILLKEWIPKELHDEVLYEIEYTI